jgi:hypothetical protein
MIEISNKLNQPLQIDFGEFAIRLEAKETKTIESKYENHPALELNKGDLIINVLEEKESAKQVKTQKDKAVK